MRVYLTHLQHTADKMHIAFVFRSSLELLMETRMGQGLWLLPTQPGPL